MVHDRNEWIRDFCCKCNRLIKFKPHLAYYDKKEPVCPDCIKIFINPLRKSLGKADIWIAPKAYEVLDE